VNFASSVTGTLKIDLPSAFNSPITDFQTTNQIDLAGLTATAALYSDGDLTLFNRTAPVEQLTVSTPYSRNLFSVTPDGSGGTFVAVSPPPQAPIPSDFNADGYSDILWQNTGGQAAISEMHGTNSIGGGLAKLASRRQFRAELAGKGERRLLRQRVPGHSVAEHRRAGGHLGDERD